MAVKKSYNLLMDNDTENQVDINMTDLSKVLADVEPESKIGSKDEHGLEIDTTEIVLENPGSEPVGLDTESMKIDLADQEQSKFITDSLLKNSDLILDSILGNSIDPSESLKDNVENDISQQSTSNLNGLDRNNVSHNDLKSDYNLFSSTNNQEVSPLNLEARPNIEQDSNEDNNNTVKDHNSIEKENCKNNDLGSANLSASENCKNVQTHGEVSNSDQDVDNHEDIRKSSLKQQHNPRKEDLRLSYVVSLWF